MNSFADWLWGKKAKFLYLFIATCVMLFAFLGGREIWTQEHRWADIVSGMFFRNDFLHPYLNEVNYYDKPLLSYWLVAAVSYVIGHVSSWALRLPSAFAGLLAVWSIYRLGTILKNKSFGLLAGWILITTFYFIFWARTSSADMLNMAGSLFAVCWYFEKKNNSDFLSYTIFFLILAITSLCKGLVGIIVPLIAIFPDILMNREWKKHINLSLIPAVIPAIIVYALPFWASAHFGGDSYEQNGLYLVYRENVLRYFQPFDHKGPIYTYFVFLPVYLLPWAIFFIPALFSLTSRWKNMSSNSKWMIWSVLLLFLFFTLSGSRRNYYVLPLVPFAILIIADWIQTKNANTFTHRNMWAGRLAVIFFFAFFLSIDVMQSLYYAQGGTQDFAIQLQKKVTQIKPWSQWRFVMLDPESKTRFYLQLPPQVKNYSIDGKRESQTEASLLKTWPMLKNKDSDVIFISRKVYEPLLKNILTNYEVVESIPNFGERILRIHNNNAPVAFIPKLT